jgi:putative SOS response-associated peptidase YedK
MRRLFQVDRRRDHLGNAQSLPSIFPKTMSPMVTIDPNGHRQLENAHWGFVLPQRSTRTGLPIQPKVVNNARDDKLRTSRFWKSSFEIRRYLVPATSFCEPKGKRPATFFWFGLKGEDPRPPFAFAGIWTLFDGIYGQDPRKILTSTIITTKPNELVAEVHPDRMPGILEPHNYQT